MSLVTRYISHGKVTSRREFLENKRRGYYTPEALRVEIDKLSVTVKQNDAWLFFPLDIGGDATTLVGHKWTGQSTVSARGERGLLSPESLDSTENSFFAILRDREANSRLDFSVNSNVPGSSGLTNSRMSGQAGPASFP